MGRRGRDASSGRVGRIAERNSRLPSRASTVRSCAPIAQASARALAAAAFAMLAFSASAEPGRAAGPAAAADASPQHRAAAMLDRWEGCIDSAVREQARLNPSGGDIARLAEAGCAAHGAGMKPVLKEALRAMMFASSERQVGEQADVAFDVLRRHIRSRAASAADKIQAGRVEAGR